MPVNWSLLNPSLPASAQTINPFAALDAGRAQAAERVQNQQAGELRGLQIQGAKAELADKETAGEAASLAAQAWQLRESDPAKAADAFARGMRLNPTTFSATTQKFVQQARDEAATASSRETALTAQQKRDAPFMLQAVQMAKGGDVEGARNFLKSQGLYDPRHEEFLTNPQLLAPFEQTLRSIVPINPRTEMTAYQRALADSAERRAKASETAANRPSAASSGTSSTPPAAPVEGPQTKSARDKLWAAKVLADPSTPAPVREAARVILNGKPNQQAQRTTAVIQRQANAVNLVAAETGNIAAYGDLADLHSGVYGVGSGPGESVFDAGKDYLRMRTSSNGTRLYTQLAAGIRRQLGTAESPGYMVSNALMEQMSAYEFRAGEPVIMRMSKLAGIRQIMEETTHAMLATPGITPEQSRTLRAGLARIQKAIPYTQGEIVTLIRAQESDPRATLSSIRRMQRQQATGATANGPAGVFSNIQIPGIGAPAPAAPAAAPAPAVRPAAPASGARPPLDSFRR